MGIVREAEALAARGCKQVTLLGQNVNSYRDGSHDFADLLLAVTDIQDACDVLRPAWERTGGIDGYVSLEVDPRLAYDTERTFAQAKRLSMAIYFHRSCSSTCCAPC